MAKSASRPQRTSSSLAIGTGLLVGVMACAILLGYQVARFGLNAVPGATGDEPDYDSLGWELSHGRGYQLDTGNAEFRRPYELAKQESPTPELFELGPARQGPVTSRPPLVPITLAVGDLLWGRQFWWARLINSFCLASVLAMTAGFLVRRFDWRIVVLASLFLLLLDVRIRLYSRAILTEALAAFWVAGLCLLLFRWRAQGDWRDCAAAGQRLGFAILTRSQLILWLPGVLLTVVWISRSRTGSAETDHSAASESAPSENRPQEHRSGAWQGVSSLIIATLLVLALWGVRNSLVLGSFMPLGTQGMEQLAAGYGDAIWDNAGIWQNLDQQGFFKRVAQPQASLIDQELAKAQFSRDVAVAWIQSNPGKAVALFPMKIWQSYRPRSISQAILLGLIVIGSITSIRQTSTKILLGVLAINAVAIGVTWSVGDGRFRMPVLFAELTLAGWGACAILHQLVGFRSIGHLIQKDHHAE